jgi:hypothetical protein
VIMSESRKNEGNAINRELFFCPFPFCTFYVLLFFFHIFCRFMILIFFFFLLFFSLDKRHKEVRENLR